MQPHVTLDSFDTPEGRPVSLHRQGTDFYIRIDGEELMSTRRRSSEIALAKMACRPWAQAGAPAVLIGGLGLGFTVAAALEVLPESARVEVAEIFPQIVRWNREHPDDFGKPLTDTRVRVHERDVCDVVAQASPGTYAAIMLDVDNGPEASSLESNGRLYTTAGLRRLRRALAPRGILAVWSAAPDREFARRMSRERFETTVETVRAHRSKSSRHTIFLGRRTG